MKIRFVALDSPFPTYNLDGNNFNCFHHNTLLEVLELYISNGWMQGMPQDTAANHTERTTRYISDTTHSREINLNPYSAGWSYGGNVLNTNKLYDRDVLNTNKFLDIVQLKVLNLMQNTRSN